MNPDGPQQLPGSWSTRPGAKIRKWWIIIFAFGRGAASGSLLSTRTCSLMPVM
jgi:hypothetical protein